MASKNEAKRVGLADDGRRKRLRTRRSCDMVKKPKVKASLSGVNVHKLSTPCRSCNCIKGGKDQRRTRGYGVVIKWVKCGVI